MVSDFGTFFTALRKRSGLSQRKLAEQAGISLRTLAYWESGQFEPREPELLKALKALGASENDSKDAFARMTAPRGFRFVRNDSISTRSSKTDAPLIPGFGSLLVAMRSRCNYSQEKAARELGVNLSTIVRWERMKWIPSPESLEQLCDALKAFPEERHALANWRTLLNPACPDATDLSVLRDQVRALEQMVRSRTEERIDVVAITLQIGLWRHMPNRKAARELFAETLAWYSVWLESRQRIKEASFAARRALSAAKAEFSPQTFWSEAILVEAACAASRSHKRKPEAALEVITKWINDINAPHVLAPLLCQASEYAVKCRKFEDGSRLLDRAYAQVMASTVDREQNLSIYWITLTGNLIAMGQYSRVRDLLPHLCVDQFAQRYPLYKPHVEALLKSSDQLAPQTAVVKEGAVPAHLAATRLEIHKTNPAYTAQQ